MYDQQNCTLFLLYFSAYGITVFMSHLTVICTNFVYAVFTIMCVSTKIIKIILLLLCKVAM